MFEEWWNDNWMKFNVEIPSYVFEMVWDARQAEIDDLKAENEALKTEIQELKDKLEYYESECDLYNVDN